MMRLYSLGAAGTGIHGSADALAIDAVTDTNDHEKHLHVSENDCQYASEICGCTPQSG